MEPLDETQDQQLITVPLHDYLALLHKSDFLDMLEAHGVRHWPGYGDTCDAFCQPENGD